MVLWYLLWDLNLGSHESHRTLGTIDQPLGILCFNTCPSLKFYKTFGEYKVTKTSKNKMIDKIYVHVALQHLFFWCTWTRGMCMCVIKSRRWLFNSLKRKWNALGYNFSILFSYAKIIDFKNIIILWIILRSHDVQKGVRGVNLNEES